MGNDVLRRRARNQDELCWIEKTQALVRNVVAIQKRSKMPSSVDIDLTHSTEELMREASNLTITREFFKDLIEHQSFREHLRELGISSEDIPDLFDTFDADDSGTMTIVEQLKGIKKLRGDPRRSDVIGVSLVVQAIHELVAEVTEQIRVQSQQIKDIEASLLLNSAS